MTANVSQLLSLPTGKRTLVYRPPPSNVAPRKEKGKNNFILQGSQTSVLFK